ncbi:hypothetical protein HRS9139_04759 [Pyrenophora teres f. teres]|nr:hypothetical protein HRS9139_04759 [Pyrenophora teres f. teres]
MIKTAHYSISMPVVSPHTTPILPQSSTEHYARDAPPIGYDTRPSCDSTSKEKKSLDLVQKLERKLAEYNASQNVFKRWLFEITSWLVSALCMGAVIVIYARIGGKEMVHSEQLLALVSLFGKIASAALIVPTSEALGQLKWNWFQKSNAMWDFEIFDKASRGPWGAVLLLFRTKGRSLAALGALLIVLLLAIDTFFQQVVTYTDGWAPQNASSSIPIVKHYDPPYQAFSKAGVDQGQTDPTTSALVRSYFYGNGSQPVLFGNGTRPDIPLSCPSSRCEWPEYDTLATCSSCKEVSQSLDITYACLNTTIDWSVNWQGPLTKEPYPNGTVCGYFLNITDISPILLSGYVAKAHEYANTTDEALLVRTIPLADFDTREPYYGNGSISFKNIRNPIFDFLVASAVNGAESVYGNEPPVIHECVLSWCVHRMKSSYISGIYNEDILSTYLNIATHPTPWPWYAEDQMFEYYTNITIEVPTSTSQDPGSLEFSTTYSVWNDTAFMIMAIWDDLAPSFYTVKDTISEPTLRFKNYADGPSMQHLDFNPWLAPNNITRHMERLASSLTNALRSNANSNLMLKGEAYNMNKFIHINWGWLAFPLVLLILSLVFLVATIIRTSRDTETGLFKSSALPTLIYGLPKETQGQFTSSSTWNSTEETKKVRIRLNPKTGWRVSGQSQLSTSPQLPRPAVQPHHSWI